VVLHHQVRITALGFPDLQHTHNVRMAGQPTHSALLAQKPLPVLVKFGGENLHRHRALQRDLSAPIDNAETTATDLFSISESGSTQFRDGGQAHVALGPERVVVHHRFPAMWLSISREQTTDRLSTAPARPSTPTVRAGRHDDGDAPLARLAELRCAYCGLSHAGPCDPVSSSVPHPGDHLTAPADGARASIE
jgi:hypothetical protein